MIELFTVENFLDHMPADEDEPRPVAREILEERLPQALNALRNIRTLEYFPEDDYRQMEVLDVLTEGYVAKLLNDNGFACATCCPGCHCDDFTHIERCPVSFYNQ